MTLIASLGPAVITALVALGTVYLTNRGHASRLTTQLKHEQQKQREELLRARGEELYGLLHEWKNGFEALCLIQLSVMRGEMSYNEGLDLQTKDNKEVDFGRLQMLMAIYFPGFQQRYDELLLLRDKVSKIAQNFRRSYIQGHTDGKAYVMPYSEAHLKLHDAIDALKMAVASHVRSLGSAEDKSPTAAKRA